jgi:hypothetical protein
VARWAGNPLLAWLLSLCAAQGAAVTPGVDPTSWLDLKDADSYSFASNRLNFPSGVFTRPGGISGLGQVFNNTPPYSVTSIRFLYANFYVVPDGTVRPERTPGNENSIDFATVFVNGNAYALTFNGETHTVLRDGAFVWSDPLRDQAGNLVELPANSNYLIRTSRSAPAGGGLVVGSGNFGVQPRLTHQSLGEGVEYTAAAQYSKRVAGTVAAYSEGSMPVGPSIAIAKGWDGSAVYLLVGDSIGVGQGDYDFGPRGVVGYLERGLDDDLHSKRRNFATMTISGTKPDDQASGAPGEYQLRLLALRSIPNRPFNVILSEMGQNSPTIAGTSLAAFQEVESRWWAFWHDACPDCAIFQTTFPPHAGAAHNSKWTAATAETTDYPNGMRWQAGRWFRTGPLPTYLKVLDVTPAFSDVSRPGVWKTPSWSGTIAAAVSAGDLRVQVNSASAPTTGDSIVIGPGSPTVDARNIVYVTGDGAWTVSVNAGFSNSHAIGESTALAYTVDGTHPTSTLYKAAATVIESYKAAGMLP